MSEKAEKSIIKIRGLSKTFRGAGGEVQALTDVDLDIREGEIFGVIGLSGAGKSTLVRCINLLERPSTGTVEVCGREMTALTRAELPEARRGIGMIFQGFNLLMQRTAEENIRFPLEIAGVRRSEARARARELLELVGLSERAQAYPAQLSGGQRQRVAIARALAARPRVLLCDEATSALDPTTTQSILELIREINRSMGVTVVVITHEMRVIEQICHRVAIIDRSRICELGTPDEVFIRPQSEAGRRLLYPGGEPPQSAGACGAALRLAFDGEITDKPIIAGMVLATGAPVNILYASTRVIDGRTYGQTVLRLPADGAAKRRMLAYLDAEGVTYQLLEEGSFDA